MECDNYNRVFFKEKIVFSCVKCKNPKYPKCDLGPPSFMHIRVQLNNLTLGPHG